VDLVSLVKSLLDLLRRSLGETVEITTRFERNLGQALVDPSQLEHAIINLAVNARDAMGSGGKLLIEAANASLDKIEVAKHGASATSFVVLSITDTGMGMTDETKSRAFDPFFTTKDVGKGSGLGLSMVYGFVRQSGGFVNIHSRPDEGTTVELFLPKALGLADEEEPDTAERGLVHGSGETVLVVEDDPRVLDFTTRLCSRLGYVPIAATNAREALQALGDTPDVAVLFSDMILPGGVNGVELALRARRVRPDLPVLLTSGYADPSILELQQSLPGVGMISKPFDTMTLATSLRSLLDE
jgi:CheY-like chemotaxis protein